MNTPAAGKVTATPENTATTPPKSLLPGDTWPRSFKTAPWRRAGWAVTTQNRPSAGGLRCTIRRKVGLPCWTCSVGQGADGGAGQPVELVAGGRSAAGRPAFWGRTAAHYTIPGIYARPGLRSLCRTCREARAGNQTTSWGAAAWPFRRREPGEPGVHARYALGVRVLQAGRNRW